MMDCSHWQFNKYILSSDWMHRYWGDNYNRLLAIKVTVHLKLLQIYNLFIYVIPVEKNY